MPLSNKTVILGVSGGIAAYKIANLASSLKKLGCNVHVIMTKNATNFIAPLTFETLTQNRCVTDMFANSFKWDVEHISLAKSADVFMVAPATANIIAKMANGVADNMLTTTILAAKCPKIVAPAMNTGMLENPITIDNIEKLKKYGFQIVDSDEGMLACKDIGKGRLPDTNVLLSAIEYAITKKDLVGKHVLVTAGPTCEEIDPVRYITNHSSGKMGYAVAEAAAMRGAQVNLISGKTALPTPYNVNRIDVVSAQDMFERVKEYSSSSDIIVKAAAVGDYRPKSPSASKIKKSDDDIKIELTRNDDILKYLGRHKKNGQIICGFSMETDNIIENSRQKLDSKNADIIVANSIAEKDAGFAVDTNKVTLITKDDIIPIETMSKRELADVILDKLI